MNRHSTSRRIFLRGLGALVGLPFLESLHAATAAAKPPLRFGWIFFPNGMVRDFWTPQGEGRKHDHGDLPCVVAGHAGGALTGGRYLRMKDETPMANLFVTTAHLAGTKLDRFGDSTGALALG